MFPGGFLRQMNDTIEANRKLLRRRLTVEKIKETYREQVLRNPSHYGQMNPEQLKIQIRRKLARNQIVELFRYAYAAGLIILLAAGVVWIILVMTSFSKVHAQIPQDIPHQSEPVDFTSLPNILIYIGVPVLMVIVYIWWRRKSRNQ